MKKLWLNPELSELSVVETETGADEKGRPLPDAFPGYITCHEPVTGHPVTEYVRDLGELRAFYDKHDDCPPDGFFYEYRPSASS